MQYLFKKKKNLFKKEKNIVKNLFLNAPNHLILRQILTHAC